jgi:hypothetical protein
VKPSKVLVSPRAWMSESPGGTPSR